MRFKSLSGVAVAVVLAAGMPATARAAEAGTPCPGLPARCADGQLTDGTPYTFAKPDRWNGTVRSPAWVSGISTAGWSSSRPRSTTCVPTARPRRSSSAPGGCETR